jgi:hypothetical protein
MKKLLIIVGVFITHLSFAQVNNFKNSFGASINSFSSSFAGEKLFYQRKASLQYEHFYKPNRSFEIGLNSSNVARNTISNLPNYYSQSIGFSVAMKRYMPIKPIDGLYFTFKTGIGYNRKDIFYQNFYARNNEINLYIEPGLTYFITPKLAIDVNYNMSMFSSRVGSQLPNLGRNNFGMGIKYYFGKKSKE